MKQSVVFLLFLTVAFSAQANKRIKEKIHILPDSPGWIYLEKSKNPSLLPRSTSENEGEIVAAIQLGERNLAWLTYMNQFRDDDNKLKLTKPGDLKGIPIEAPSKYSGATVLARYQELEEQIPSELKAVLYSSVELPKDLPVTEEVYVQWARAIDKNYQTAVRWKMMQPWLGMLELDRKDDIRGWYHLSKKTENVESLLRSLDTLPEDQRLEIQIWLEQMCQNTEGLFKRCQDKTKAAIDEKKAYEFYLKYLPGGERIWNSNFSLHNPRREFVWNNKNPLEMMIPFRDPKNTVILDFLKVNIEDEFKWNDWKMILNFKPSAAVHVEFQSGVTPHVNGVGGDTIVMDKNTPLTEWDVQWTIRHEFGHVLGFVDCYLEFYDPKEKVIINYQLDIEHLMCARSGRMNQAIFDTLKKQYFKPTLQ